MTGEWQHDAAVRQHRPLSRWRDVTVLVTTVLVAAVYTVGAVNSRGAPFPYPDRVPFRDAVASVIKRGARGLWEADFVPPAAPAVATAFAFAVLYVVLPGAVTRLCIAAAALAAPLLAIGWPYAFAPVFGPIFIIGMLAGRLRRRGLCGGLRRHVGDRPVGPAVDVGSDRRAGGAAATTNRGAPRVRGRDRGHGTRRGGTLMTDASADAGIGSHRTWRWQLRDRAVIVGTLAVIPFYLLGAVNAVASPVPYGVRTTLREAVVVAVRGLADPWIILAALPPAGVAVAVAAAFVWSRSHGPRLALALTAFVLTLPMGAIGIFFGLPMAATEILLGRLDGETLHEGLIAYAAFGMWMMLWGAAALLEALLPTPAPAPPGFPVEGPTNAPG